MPKRVLIVDDDPEFLEELTMSLCMDDYDVIPLNNPSQALRTAVKTRPDVVLLDISMPQKNGFQLASEMTCFSSLSYGSIILMTGLSRETHAALMRSCGFKSFLKKPFCYEELLSAIENQQH